MDQTTKSTEPLASEAKTAEKPSLSPDEPLIPKAQEIIPHNFHTQQRGIQEERFAKFFDTAINDIATFVRRTIGTSYESKNNFSFTQKQKIMGYMYFKNNEELAKSRIFTYLDVKPGATRESIQNRIDHINEMKNYNRSFFIYNLAKCQNRLRTNGYIWGSVTACLVWNTIMKNSSHLRKLAVSAFLIHAAGQITSYRSMDRVFDGIYPIFFKDFSEHVDREIKEGEDSLFQDTFKDHEITQLIKEQVYDPKRALKRIEEKTLYNDDI